MSNYHVKEITPDGRRARVVFHIPIPVENNSAGFSLRTAVSQYKGEISQVPWIGAGELAQVVAGELYEHSETISFLAADTNAQKQARIDAKYVTLSTSILDKARTILKFWGKDRDV